MADLKVMIIGASGVFGSRLAERAALEEGVALILAGRTEAKLAAVARGLAKEAVIRVLDRDSITGEDLLGCDLVIDAAGPFQASHDRVIRAALSAGVPYIDLADGRAFLRDFPQYDAAANVAGISMISGASSLPALSHAVIDELVAGWRAIDSIRVGIFPANRAPRGLSVVQAILSYVGKPVRVFREGRWQEVPGWGMLHRVDIQGVGKRWASVFDTPEQDLLVARYHPRRAAEFFAGLELSLLHVGLAALGWTVRWGWLKSLQPFARPLRSMARWFLPFGSDRGAMTVHVAGDDAQGQKIQRQWTLRANRDRGPYVPVLAALALIRRHRDGAPPERGARACVGVLQFRDFASDFVALGITCAVEDSEQLPDRC